MGLASFLVKSVRGVATEADNTTPIPRRPLRPSLYGVSANPAQLQFSLDQVAPLHVKHSALGMALDHA